MSMTCLNAICCISFAINNRLLYQTCFSVAGSSNCGFESHAKDDETCVLEQQTASLHQGGKKRPVSTCTFIDKMLSFSWWKNNLKQVCGSTM